MRWLAEWEPHEAVWIGFPGDPAEWPVGLDEAQYEVAAFANAVSDGGYGEQVLLICHNPSDAAAAVRLVGDDVQVIVEPFGDIWLRDTCPIITVQDDIRTANLFRFNGWGGKYEMAGDQDIGSRLAARADIAVVQHGWILEGGAIDGDGAGRLITTEQCLLNPNRNADMTKTAVEAKLKAAFACNDICWFGNGLLADHTDGHVDNLARFVAAGTVAIAQADDSDDPNHEVFEDASRRAADAGLKVIRLPSVGKYEIDSSLAPASYLNFYIGNKAVVVPQFDDSNDSIAVKEIAALFPDRKTTGLSSKALLRGGGSFHCISQQIPAL